MDRTQVISCPHGEKSRYKYFRWMHEDDDLQCNVLGSSRYEDVAGAWHARKGVEEMLLAPDYAYLVTPEGFEALCQWLTEGGTNGDAALQFGRMVMVVKSPLFILLGSTLRRRVKMFQRNMRYLTREAYIRDVKWLKMELPGVHRKMYDAMDFWKHRPDPKTHDVLQKVRSAIQKHRTDIDEKARAAAEAMRQRNMLKEVRT